MYETISYCGLDCSQCPAYLATQGGDREALEKVAADWSRRFGMEVTVEGVICDGCKSDTERQSGYCGICEVRACGVGKGVITCAHCEDYDCETLRGCPAYRSTGKSTLDRIRDQGRDLKRPFRRPLVLESGSPENDTGDHAKGPMSRPDHGAD